MPLPLKQFNCCAMLLDECFNIIQANDHAIKLFNRQKLINSHFKDLLESDGIRVQRIDPSSVTSLPDTICLEINERRYIFTIAEFMSEQGEKNFLVLGNHGEQIFEGLENLNFLRKVIDNLPQFIFWKDKYSKFLGCNNNFAKLVHLESPRDIVGKTDYDLSWTKEQSDKYVADDLEIITSAKPRLFYEETQRQSDGKEHTVLVSKIPLYSNPERKEVSGVICIYQDITERKEMELQLRESKRKSEAASKAKTIFIANMSHDLRTPLGAISALAQLVAAEVDDEGIKQKIQMIHESGERVLDIANEVLEISSLDLGETSLYREENFQPHVLVKKVVQTLQPAAFNKGLDLLFNISTAVPSLLKGYDILIHRVLLNLVSNAIKFTDAGRVEVRLDYDQVAANLLLEVADTGIGIEKSKYEEIFGLFQRLTPSYQNLYRGAGLGLYLVKQFVDYMHGSVTLESIVNQGTVFRCEFPVKPATGKVAANIEDVYLTSGAQTDLMETSGKLSVKSAQCEQKSSVSVGAIDLEPSKINVLLVEDDKISRMIAADILTTLDCHVVVASDSQEAINIANQKAFDIIFMDIGLPDQDGVFTAQQIRTTKNPNQDTPIASLTAHALGVAKKQCLAAGMDYVLQKPLTQEKIQKILQQFNTKLSK